MDKCPPVKHIVCVPDGFAESLSTVLIMAAYPELSPIALVPVLGREVQIVVGGIQQVDATPMRRIGVKHAALWVPEEYADSLLLCVVWSLCSEVVQGFFLGRLFRCERHVVVEIEVCLER